jgi:hypothetical protein
MLRRSGVPGKKADNNFVQATPVSALLLFLSQISGAPDDNH